jgi:hypothetical protein
LDTLLSIQITGGTGRLEGVTKRLQIRYCLPVKASEPVKTVGRVSTWKLTIETRPGQRQLTAQRIHLDI